MQAKYNNMTFNDKIKNRQSGILTYGITPPKENNKQDKLIEISQRQADRISSLGVDALVLYDLQDEKDRIKDERPFPFLPTIDPIDYSHNYLHDLKIPRILYRCTAKYTREEFLASFANTKAGESYVFVGASAPEQKVAISLDEAYNTVASEKIPISFGGVVIPERHLDLGDEHERVIGKMSKGCEFFISQAVYNVVAAKNFLSDYYYACEQRNIPIAPVLFTLAPCGSAKTLEFMKWLGINFPKWLENDLLNACNILEKSVDICCDIAEALHEYSQEKGIPIGFNIESVSIRKVEIDASVEMVKRVKIILGR